MFIVAIRIALLPAFPLSQPRAWPLKEGDYTVVEIRDGRWHLLSRDHNRDLHATVRLVGVRLTESFPHELTSWHARYLGRQVTLRLGPRRITPDGTRLAYLMDGDVLINAEVTRLGLGTATIHRVGNAALSRKIREAEQLARSESVGIWRRSGSPRSPAPSDNLPTNPPAS